MKMSRSLTVSFLLLVGAIVAFVKYYPSSEDEHIHYHAGFIVYVDGVKQDYSDFKYMNFRPCTTEEVKQTKADEQIEKAHLHDGIGDVVHVETTGSVWGDLFKNIGVNLPTDLAVLKNPIEPNSSVVIAVGKEVDNPEKVSLDHIKDVEAKSELCGSGE